MHVIRPATLDGGRAVHVPAVAVATSVSHDQTWMTHRFVCVLQSLW